MYIYIDIWTFEIFAFCFLCLYTYGVVPSCIDSGRINWLLGSAQQLTIVQERGFGWGKKKRSKVIMSNDWRNIVSENMRVGQRVVNLSGNVLFH